jgi:hypothetical protein
MNQFETQSGDIREYLRPDHFLSIDPNGFALDLEPLDDFGARTSIMNASSPGGADGSA